MANAYLVVPTVTTGHTVTTGRTVTTVTSWDAIPFDNQLMIWRYAHEHMLADRLRDRVLSFQFTGFIELADSMEL